MRRHRRGNERGAALFIVVMVIVMLSAIGVFAVRASSLVEVASGYNRRASQAFYVSEFAVRSAAGYLPGRETYVTQRMSDTTAPATCRASRRLVEAKAASRLPADAPVHCFEIGNEHIQQILPGSLPDGLMGQMARPGVPQPAEGHFVVEMTDLGPAPGDKAGEDLAGPHSNHRQVTFTAMGTVRPAGNACTAALVQSTAAAWIRAQVTYME